MTNKKATDVALNKKNKAIEIAARSLAASLEITGFSIDMEKTKVNAIAKGTQVVFSCYRDILRPDGLVGRYLIPITVDVDAKNEIVYEGMDKAIQGGKITTTATPLEIPMGHAPNTTRVFGERNNVLGYLQMKHREGIKFRIVESGFVKKPDVLFYVEVEY